jgi:tetratricopeptide (TPR) repeat protein
MKKGFLFIFVILFCIICISSEQKKSVYDAMQMMNRALAEKKQGNYKNALSIFLFCFDNAKDFEEKFLSIKRSFLMIYLKQMLTEYQPTRNALELRFHRILIDISKGKIKIEDLDSFYELITILDKAELVYRSFKILDRNNLNPNDYSKLIWEIHPILYDKKEYTILYKKVDILGKIKNYEERMSKMEEIGRSVAVANFIAKLIKYRTIFIFNNDHNAIQEIDKILDKYK